MKKLTYYFAWFFVGLLNAQSVSTNAELNTAIANAVAGTTITLANGTWTNVQINIQKTGTLTNPITIQAQTPGSVFFEGNCYVKMGGAFIIFKGVVFQNPPVSPSTIDTSNALIDFRSSSDCNNCTVTNIKIDSYNALGKETDVYKWLLLRGANNEISFSTFIGKNGVGSIINDNRSSNIANYHKIHHNYFANRTPVGEVNILNDQDAIRIGNSSTSLSDSFTEVYNNYFYNFSGEIEVISNKSGANKYYNNTFEDYQGALTLRHGNNCEVYNNFFLANGKPFSGGVRVMGENHKIYNNYIEGVRSRRADNSLSNGTGAINIANGRTDGVLNGYLPVKNTTIVNNTLVNCDYGIRVGTKFDTSQSVAPDNVVIGNNIIFLDASIPNASSNRAIQIVTQLTGASSKYENNIKQTGIWDSFGTVTNTGNINVTSGLLASVTNFFNLVAGSAAINYGLGNYPFLTEDIFGGTRTANFDAGAEEFGAGGTKRPYKQSDVGIKVGFGGSPALTVNETILKQKKLHVYPVPVKDAILNISLEGQKIGAIEIIDVLGRTVLDGNLKNSKEEINIENLSKGTYFLKVEGISKMFIKN